MYTSESSPALEKKIAIYVIVRLRRCSGCQPLHLRIAIDALIEAVQFRVGAAHWQVDYMYVILIVFAGHPVNPIGSGWNADVIAGGGR